MYSEMDGQAWKQVLENIAIYGYGSVSMIGGQSGPSCFMTVGLACSYQRPDLVVLGLHDEMAAWFVHRIVQRYQCGARFDDGVVVDGVSTRPIVLRDIACAAVQPLAPFAIDYYARRGRSPVFQQLVLADRDGRFPWDPGCAWRMPQLWEDVPVRPHREVMVA